MSRTTVTAPLTPKFLDDKYGTHYSKYGVGGAQTGYASINEVYLIPVEKREALMIVSVINYGGEPALFWLKTTSSDPLVLADNANWDIIPIGANLGGGVVYKGAFSPITGIIDGGTTPIVDPPTLSPPNSVNGEFYVANGSGTIDFGLGAQTFNNLDYAIFDGARWRLLPGSALASWNTLSDRPQILIDIGNGTIVPANQSDLTALDTRVGALESAQLTSTNSITVDSALVTTTTAVRAYSYSKGEVNTIVAGIGTGGQITAKYYSWLWSEGTVGGGGTYIDFVISTATEDGEIGSEVSSQLFVGKSLQTQNYSLQDTNFASDTIRIILSGSTPSPTTEVDFYYNNSGLAYPSSITAGNIVYDNAVSGLAATDVQAMGDELTILAAGHIHETIRYVDTVNGLDTNNGQYNSPYKTLTKALAERMLTENLTRAFKIKILNAAGDLGTVTFDGTGLGFVQTWIVGEGSINVTAATWIGTLNITNCGYYFYLENCPPLDINMTQTSTHWCKLGIQGGTPSGAITRTGNQNYTIIDLWNVRYSLTTQFTSIINVRFGATLNLSGTAGYFTRVNLYDGGVVAVNSQAFVVDWASFYGGIVEIGDGGSANIGNNDLSIFASTVEKHPNSSFTLGDTPTSPSVGVWSKYVSFEPGASGITATNVEDAVKEIYNIDNPVTSGLWYVSTNGSDTLGNGSEGRPFLTIQKAIDSAGAEDSIIVGGGTYGAAITVNKAVSITSLNDHAVALTGALSVTSNATSITGVYIGDLAAGSGNCRYTRCIFGYASGGSATGLFFNCDFEDDITFTGSNVYIYNPVMAGTFTSTAGTLLVFGGDSSGTFVITSGTASFFASKLNVLTHNGGTVNLYATKPTTINGTTASPVYYDYTNEAKTWYVDGTYGNDSTGDGARGRPFATIQEAYDARITDGALWGKIVILNPNASSTVGSLTATITALDTLITTDGDKDTFDITTVSVTDVDGIYFKNINIGTLTITQTLTNFCRTRLINCSTVLPGSNSINDSARARLYLSGESSVTCNTLMASMSIYATQGVKVNINSSITLDTMLLEDSTLNSSGTLTITNLTAESSFIKLNGTADVINVSGAYNEEGVVLLGLGSINANGTESVDEMTLGVYGDRTVEVTLTQAQIQALNTTGISIVPTPGTGKMIEILDAVAIYDFNTAAFVTGTTLQIQYVGGSPVLSTTASFITSAADRNEKLLQSAAYVIPANTAVEITANADSTGGNAASTIKVRVTYRIVNV